MTTSIPVHVKLYYCSIFLSRCQERIYQKSNFRLKRFPPSLPEGNSCRPLPDHGAIFRSALPLFTDKTRPQEVPDAPPSIRTAAILSPLTFGLPFFRRIFFLKFSGFCGTLYKNPQHEVFYEKTYILYRICLSYRARPSCLRNGADRASRFRRFHGRCSGVSSASEALCALSVFQLRHGRIYLAGAFTDRHDDPFTKSRSDLFLFVYHRRFIRLASGRLHCAYRAFPRPDVCRPPRSLFRGDAAGFLQRIAFVPHLYPARSV